MEDKKTIVGLVIVLLASLGFNVADITDDSPILETLYVCNGLVENFPGGISGTGISAYPHKENRTGRKYCYNENNYKVPWQSWISYSKENNINILDYQKPVKSQTGWGNQYRVTKDGVNKI